MHSSQRSLFFAAFVALGFVMRESAHIWKNSHFARGPLGIPYPEMIASPRVFEQRLCGVPDVFYSLADAKNHQEKVRSWCLPKWDNARNKASSALARLKVHMIKERGNFPGLAAPHVGVPLKIVLFGDKLLLNPVIRAKKGESWCEVRPPLGGEPVRIHYHKWMDVEYQLSDGGISSLIIVGEKEACAMKMLLLAI